MNVLLYGQVYKPTHRDCLLDVLHTLQQEGLSAYAYMPYWEQTDRTIKEYAGIQPFIDFDQTPVDVLMAFGGDGTVLGAISMINEREVPIMGINLGRLGFLSSIEGRLGG